MLEEERRRRLRAKYPVRAYEDDSRIPPRKFFYGGHFMRGSVSCTIADAGVGKSTLAIIEAVAMATGRNLLGIEPAQRLKVLLWNGEESVNELHRRVHAVCRHHGVDYRLLNDWLFAVSGLDYPIRMAPDKPELIADFEQLIVVEHIDVVKLDPLIALHSVPEDKNQQIDNIVRQWLAIAGRYGLAVDIAHHTRKAPPGSTIDMTSHDARGASALRAACRSGRVLNQMSAEQAKGWNIPATSRRAYVRIDQDKTNYAGTGDETWLHITHQVIGNGDDVGVMIRWRPPGLFEGVAMSQVEAIWREIAGSPKTWLADVRSPMWVGRLVAKHLQLNAEADRKVIKQRLQQWVANEVLVEVKGQDDKQRKWRVFVEAGPKNPMPSAPVED